MLVLNHSVCFFKEEGDKDSMTSSREERSNKHVTGIAEGHGHSFKAKNTLINGGI